MRLYDDAGAGAVDAARTLRRRAGEPERRLWRALREGVATVKWRRQVPIGPYFADFPCVAGKLVVEVDGDDHATRIEADAARSRFVEAQGYEVFRVANADVMANIGGVAQAIATYPAGRRGERP